MNVLQSTRPVTPDSAGSKFQSGKVSPLVSKILDPGSVRSTQCNRLHEIANNFQQVAAGHSLGVCLL